MIPQLNKINTKISNMLSVGSSGHNEITPFDIIACVPNTLTGQLLLYIAQDHRPPRKLNNLITNHCLKHYNSVKGKRQWTRRSKQLHDFEIKRMGEIAINSIVTFKHVTDRKLAEKIGEAKTTCQNNYVPVYDEIMNYLLMNLSTSIRKTLKKAK